MLQWCITREDNNNVDAESFRIKSFKRIFDSHTCKRRHSAVKYAKAHRANLLKPLCSDSIFPPLPSMAKEDQRRNESKGNGAAINQMGKL